MAANVACIFSRTRGARAGISLNVRSLSVRAGAGGGGTHQVVWQLARVRGISRRVYVEIWTRCRGIKHWRRCIIMRLNATAAARLNIDLFRCAPSAPPAYSILSHRHAARRHTCACRASAKHSPPSKHLPPETRAWHNIALPTNAASLPQRNAKITRLLQARARAPAAHPRRHQKAPAGARATR